MLELYSCFSFAIAHRKGFIYDVHKYTKSKVGDHQNQHIIKINKFALNGDFNCIIAISDILKY